MLQRRSSIWLLVLIIGSVFAQDVGIAVNSTDSQLVSKLDSEEKSQVTITEGPYASGIGAHSTEATIDLPEREDNSGNYTVITRYDDPVESSTIALTTKASTTSTPNIQGKSEYGKIKETARKGTIQFVLNSQSTRSPPHHYTTHHSHTYPPPHYHHYPYPNHHHHSSYHEHPHYEHHHHHYPTTSRPWPGHGGYPGGGYPGGVYPGGGYPGGIYPGYYPGYPYPPYGYPGYGYPWYPWPRNNTNSRSMAGHSDAIISEIPTQIKEEDTVKYVPFFNFLNFGNSKR